MPEPSPRTLLVIDDNPVNLKVAVSHLQGYGLEVLTARDGEAGIRRARLAHPDLILLDVNMPGLDGFETCRRLQAIPDTSDIPVVFMTARTDTQDKVQGFRAGGVDYVTKPIEPQELLARVQAQLQLRALRLRLADANADLERRVEERTAALHRELADRDRRAGENERLLAVLQEQNTQLRELTARWVDERRNRDRGLASDLHSRVTERLSLVKLHLDRVDATLPEGDAKQHLAQAQELLAPALEGAAVIHGNLEGRADAPLVQLSAREREVLRGIAQGKSNKELAADLDVARTTVSTYRSRILEKLGVTDTASLIRVAVKYGVGLDEDRP